jgi:nitric oxide reductase NorQ protein
MTAPSFAGQTTKQLFDAVVTLQQLADQGDQAARDALDKKAAAHPSGNAAKRPVTAPPALNDAPLVDKLPDKFVIRPNGERYYVRSLGEHQDVMVMRKARKVLAPVLLYGVPGCGKTVLFEAAFYDDDKTRDPRGLGFRYVPGSGDTDTSAFVGQWIAMPDGTYSWIDGPLIEAMIYGLPLLVDEVALIDPKVMAVVYSTMDGRNELNVMDNPAKGIITAKEGFFVCGACNPNAPGARMSEALLSRFLIHAEVQVDFTLMRTMGVPSKFITVCKNLQTKYKNGEISWFPAIREMLAFKKIHDQFGEKMALANIVAMAPEQDRPDVQDAVDRGMGGKFPSLAVS